MKVMVMIKVNGADEDAIQPDQPGATEMFEAMATYNEQLVNAGIMLVNVDKWRREQVAKRAFECLRSNGDKVRYWDQYALNTLFSEKWKIVDPRWNQNSHVFRIPSWDLSHYTEEVFNLVKQDPWIVHFDYKPKPWELESKHPFRRKFFQALDRTAWRWWRPRRSMRENAELVAKFSVDLFRSYRRWRQTRFSPVVRAWKYRLLGRKPKAASNAA